MTRRRAGEQGFTLIELLVVLAVIGILAAVALPQFASRQAKGFDARVAQDTRNAAAGQESYFLDNFEYSNDCSNLPGYSRSAGVFFTECSGDGVRFRITADHPSATRRCTWDSVGDPVMVCNVK